MVAARSLASHLMTQNGRVVETQRSWRTPAAGARPRTFQMAFPEKEGPQSFLVKGCTDRAATRTEMWVQFLHQNVLETVVILEEGNPPYPWCTRCDMMPPWRALNIRNFSRAQCARGAERKRRRLSEAELREISERSFKAYGKPLENVTAF